MNVIEKMVMMEVLWRCQKSTASGAPKVTVSMIVTLNDSDNQLIRKLVILVLTLGVAVYEHRKFRIISSNPKEKGNRSLDNAHPIVLLDVFQKIFWDIVTATEILEEEQLLHPMQFGIRRLHSVTAPVLMAKLIGKRQMKDKKPVYIFS